MNFAKFEYDCLEIVSNFRPSLALCLVMAQARKFSCPRYEPAQGRTCKHYANQRCGLTSGAACIEWLLAIGEPIPDGHPLVRRDLAGDFVLRTPEPVDAAPSPQADNPPAGDADAHEKPRPCPHCLREEHIESFKKLGLEIYFEFEAGHLWLVPEYTKDTRLEISVKDAVTLFLLLSTFPGAKIKEFDKLP